MNKDRIKLIGATYCSCKGEQSEDVNCAAYSTCADCYEEHTDMHIRLMTEGASENLDFECEKVRKHVPTAICSITKSGLTENCKMTECEGLVRTWLQGGFREIFNKLSDKNE